MSSLLVVCASIACGQTAASLVNQYCAGCHNNEVKSGGMAVAQLDLAHPDKNAELAGKVVHKGRAGMMPPPGMPRPDATALKALAPSLESHREETAAAPPNSR